MTRIQVYPQILSDQEKNHVPSKDLVLRNGLIKVNLESSFSIWVCWFLGKSLSNFVSPLENSTTRIAIFNIESIIILPFLYDYCNIDTAKNALEKKNILHCKGRIKTSATIFFSFVLHSEWKRPLHKRPRTASKIWRCSPLHTALRHASSVLPSATRTAAASHGTTSGPSLHANRPKSLQRPFVVLYVHACVLH